MFSTAMMPAASAALITALQVIEAEPEHREALWRNANHLRSSLKENGFNTLTSETQIIPVTVGEDEKAIAFSRKLFEKGIYAPAVRWPAVSKGLARLRLTVMATHQKSQLDYLVKSCREIGRELGVVR